MMAFKIIECMYEKNQPVYCADRRTRASIRTEVRIRIRFRKRVGQGFEHQCPLKSAQQYFCNLTNSANT